MIKNREERSWTHEGPSIKKKSWTHEGPKYLKKTGHMKVQYFKRKIAHVQRKREIVHERSSYTIHTKFHTHAHLDQGL